MSEFWWSWIFIMFLIPVMFLWGFTLVDIFTRKDIGWSKAVWATLIVVLPILGMFIYFIMRPPKADSYMAGSGAYMATTPGTYGSYMYGYGDPGSSTVRDMETINRLHDTGSITDDDFVRLKSNIAPTG